ncbi:hypothetical protein ElyMa_005876700 [Elysia marginata]|uniref:Uncharacterized protein n=1 Tax=Elysia marginata TaxID=1093978 RepID=A0AAV4G2M1_9GAST|nr:hypothetical protein ElyMa_005876700 [Elysia marginata]
MLRHIIQGTRKKVNSGYAKYCTECSLRRKKTGRKSSQRLDNVVIFLRPCIWSHRWLKAKPTQSSCECRTMGRSSRVDTPLLSTLISPLGDIRYLRPDPMLSLIDITSRPHPLLLALRRVFLEKGNRPACLIYLDSWVSLLAAAGQL